MDNNEPEKALHLQDVAIDDVTLENEDKQTKQEKKAAKKRAKRLRTPAEVKQQRQKKYLIGIGAIVAAVLILLALPFTRWTLLNSLGFRGSMTVLAQDTKSYETIGDVDILLDGNSVGTTDASGQLKLAGLRLGAHALSAKKPGYSLYESNIGVGLKTKQVNASLEPIGLKLTVNVKHWLSGEAISNATVQSGDRRAITDGRGQANIVVPPSEQKIPAHVTARGYQKRVIQLDPTVMSRDVSLVADEKDYFISKRNGTFDIYSSNLDGSDQKKIISATGNENPNTLQFGIHRANKRAVLVATRETERKNGHIIAGVYDVDLKGAALKKIDAGSNVYLVGWAGDTMLYQKTDPNLSYDDKNATSLVGYNISTGAQVTVAKANYFQLAAVVGQKVFYVSADAYRAFKPQLISFDPVTGSKQSYLKNSGISYGAQDQYGILQVETAEGAYYEVNATSGSVQKIDHQPNENQQYALSQNGQFVISPQRRDGKGSLVRVDAVTNKESVIVKIGGLSAPVRLVSNRLAVVRVATNQETADYIVDLPSGKFSKIVDVSNVGQATL